MAESYQYRASFHGTRAVAPEVVAAELEKLRRTGPLTPKRFVKAAEPEGSLVHGVFEWDDAVCGREHRLWQARQLIRAIVVVAAPTTGAPEPEPRSVFVHVPAEDGREGKYERLVTVAKTSDEYDRALGEARRFLDSAEQRFNELRRLTEGKGDKAEALAIAHQGFGAVREALMLLRTA